MKTAGKEKDETGLGRDVRLAGVGAVGALKGSEKKVREELGKAEGKEAGQASRRRSMHSGRRIFDQPFPGIEGRHTELFCTYLIS